jgi:endonuclease/exonuclease/phosphatase family metal-dependent hydrolase
MRAILPDKLDWIARMIRACDADVVGLQEVGPVELVRALLGRLEGYREPVVGTADARGIRCALLSRLAVVEARVHTAEALSFPVFQSGDPAPFGAHIPLRRGVVHARIDAPGMGPLHVMVVHFKSSRPVRLRDASGAEIEPVTARQRAEGELRSLVWRSSEALYVRGLVDDVLAAERRCRLAVVGDLNDVPESPAVRALRGDESEGALFDGAAGIDAAARFSSLHNGRPSHIDHILVTAPLHAQLKGARFLNSDLRYHGGLDGLRRNGRRNGGNGPVAAAADDRDDEPPTIDSDHAPLVVRFG